MIRGRRGIVVGVMLFLLLFPTTTQAQTITPGVLSVTARVSLSAAWKKALQENTEVYFERTRSNLLQIRVQSRGIEHIILPEQTVQALLFRDTELVAIQENTQANTEEMSFQFVYRKSGSYRLILVNRTYDFPFILKTISFSL